MKTDRELLELAAKAAGIEILFQTLRDGSGAYRAINITGLPDAFNINAAPLWNPLTDDGDALRLAVKLLLRIEHDAAYQQNQDRNTKVRVLAEHQQLIVGHGDQGQWQKEWHETDPYSATRRAIVRAAAAIGEAL